MFFYQKKPDRRTPTKGKMIDSPVGAARRLARKKSPTGRGNFFYRMAFASFIGVTAYALFFSQLLAITVVDIQGAGRIDPEMIKEEINLALSGKYLNFLPKNNILLVSQKQIKRLLGNRFKLIDNLEIKKKFPDSLLLLLVEKNPRMILRNLGQDYVIDDKGIAYPRSDFAAEIIPENELVILEDISGRKIEGGEEVLNSDYINFILDTKARIKKDLNLEIQPLITTSSTAAGYITVETKNGWQIYLSRDIGVAKELEMLNLVLSDKISKEKTGDLEYIDLRTNNKIYYKFKNNEQQSGN